MGVEPDALPVAVASVVDDNRRRFTAAVIDHGGHGGLIDWDPSILATAVSEAAANDGQKSPCDLNMPNRV